MDHAVLAATFTMTLTFDTDLVIVLLLVCGHDDEAAIIQEVALVLQTLAFGSLLIHKILECLLCQQYPDNCSTTNNQLFKLKSNFFLFKVN